MPGIRAMTHPKSGRIAGLDGLRALSVLAVFLSHTGLAGVDGGFIGVDVFFVLSGFLITRLLAAEYSREHRISLAAFYGRRARRLYPALFGVLAAVAIYCSFFEPRLSGSLEVFPALLYVMNWVRAFGGYDAALTGHTWSLAIEEQFYLLWPLVLLGLLKLDRRRALIGLVAIALTLCAWRYWLFSVDHVRLARIYSGFDTHTDGLIYGALLALMSRDWLRKVGYLWPLGAAYLCVALFNPHAVRFAVNPHGYAVTAIAAALVIARVVSAQSSLLVRGLDVAPLSGLGRVSYGFYLWHYPVIHVMLYGGHDPVMAFFGGFAYPKLMMVASTFAVSLAFTLVSWFVIEKPAMRLRFPRRADPEPQLQTR
jgi:peptidoglycan/LPS O-acetylase OafA/YrhL